MDYPLTIIVSLVSVIFTSPYSTMYFITGMFSLLNSARPEVSDAVVKARRAQIRVAMVTGDHSTTAAAIAKKVNILSKEISIDGAIDTFQIQRNNQTGQTLACLMRNSNTLLETHCWRTNHEYRSQGYQYTQQK
jgi:magnesium-transporting ATPase (P-type)